MKVEFENNTKMRVSADVIEELMRCAGKVLNLPKESKVNIFFVDDAEIRKLNRITRKINKITDVLSFPLQDDSIFDKDPEGNVSLGDIVINPKFALKNSINKGREEKKELNFLVVHGLLHLCGYDHDTDLKQDEMEKVSNKIINFFEKI
ncbi:MAG: rRNA maturation RNase YbeY [bacterium]|nr:rRNA maturation RNase YbeY [bacterium]